MTRKEILQKIRNNESLRGMDLSGADLRGMDLSGAELRGVDLSGVDLRGVELRGVELRGVELRGMDLSGADLRGVNKILQITNIGKYQINACEQGCQIGCQWKTWEEWEEWENCIDKKRKIINKHFNGKIKQYNLQVQAYCFAKKHIERMCDES